MRRSHCLWTMLSAGHLAVVLCGAGYCLPDRNLGRPAQTLRWYATMSGADSTFGFFAPEVGSEHRARFLLQDDQGRTWWDTFERTTGSEARLRLTGIVGSAFMNGVGQERPHWRQSLVKSWAATMFRRHPSAQYLTVIVEVYDVPTRAEYRAGARPSWQVVYQAQVQRHARAAQERIEP